jgi:hypothetical protein
MDNQAVPTLKTNTAPITRPPLIHHLIHIITQRIKLVRPNLQNKNALTIITLVLNIKIVRITITQVLQQEQARHFQHLGKTQNISPTNQPNQN